MLKFGERTTKYPFGYGYCQCGCGLRTNKLGRTTYATYKAEHHPRTVIRTAERKARGEIVESPQPRKGRPKASQSSLSYGESLTRFDAKIDGPKSPVAARLTLAPELHRQDVRLVDKYSDLNAEVIQLRSMVAFLESEIEFTIRYLRTLLQGDPDAINAIVHRLQASLTKKGDDHRP